MSPSSPHTGSRRRLRSVTAAVLVTCAAAGFAGLTACGSSGSSSSGNTTPASAPNSMALAGDLPSSLASLAESAKAAASAAATSAAASAGAAASSFAASVGAQLSGDQAAAKAELAKVSGPGNAGQDVQLTGVPLKETGGLHATVVTITNHSSATASFAVKVEFADSNGKVVDTTVVGAKDVAAGKKATPVAFSVKDVDKPLFPRVAQAQRY
ncbi:MAG: hypothetical protein FWE15_02460 [Actinomycetia bacterium]|nr:hypothetical protein [Actinomycetes bacterium]